MQQFHTNVSSSQSLTHHAVMFLSVLHQTPQICMYTALSWTLLQITLAVIIVISLCVRAPQQFYTEKSG
jgi:hypothetical protein